MPAKPQHQPTPAPPPQPRPARRRPPSSAQPPHAKPAPAQPPHAKPARGHATRRPAGSGPAPNHPANRTNWTTLLALLAGATRLALAAGRRAAAVATGETGRRVGRAVALTVVLAVVVGVLYDQGEVPGAAAQPAHGAAAPGIREPGARAGSARRDPGDHGGLRGRARPAPVGERPTEVAAAWYATRNGVPRAKVRPLQQDRLSAREVRVLVLADHGHGRLATALVRVRRGPDGWRVR